MSLFLLDQTLTSQDRALRLALPKHPHYRTGFLALLDGDLATNKDALLRKTLQTKDLFVALCLVYRDDDAFAYFCQHSPSTNTGSFSPLWAHFFHQPTGSSHERLALIAALGSFEDFFAWAVSYPAPHLQGLHRSHWMQRFLPGGHKQARRDRQVLAQRARGRTKGPLGGSCC